MTDILPPGFEELLPFVAYWDVPDSETRLHRRSEASMADIRAFYAVATRLGEKALAHLDGFELADMPEPEARLLRLMLSLAQAAMAVELHNEPRVPNSVYPNHIHVIKAPFPFG